MIQTQTRMLVADNSWAKEAMCIKVLWGSKRRYAWVGDTVVVAIKKASPKGTVKKKSVERAVVIRTRKQNHRKDWTSIRFDDNACVIISKEWKPKGTRVFGPVARELREKWFQSIISKAPEVL